MTPDDPDADIITTGVDGQPTRMAATRCARAALAAVVAEDVRVCGRAADDDQVGWGGERAACSGSTCSSAAAPADGGVILSAGSRLR